MTLATRKLKLSAAKMIGAVALLAIMLAGVATQPARAAAPVPLTCSTYELLYNAKIGSRSFPKGIYAITILNKEKAVCDYVQQQFEAFIQNVNNKLEKPWVMKQTSEGEGEEKVVTTTFKRGKKSKLAFTAVPTLFASTPPPNAPLVETEACKGNFKIGKTTPIIYRKSIGTGTFNLKKGSYRLAPVNTKQFGCGKAKKAFRNYLKRGRIPNNWKLQPSVATFKKRSDRKTGFYITRNYADKG